MRVPYITFTVNVNKKAIGGVDYYAYGTINESFMGPRVIDAMVTINGTMLPYNATITLYQLNSGIVPDSFGKLNLSVAIGGKTYTAVQDAPDSLPALSVPLVLNAASTNQVTWTPNISATGLTPTSYGLTVFTFQNPGTTDVYRLETTGTTMIIPTGTMTVGTTYYVGIGSKYNVQSISNAAQSSNFTVFATPVSISRVAQ